jgi:molecular chaperone HtpG
MILPLNVSREILQNNPLVDSIKKAVTKRTLDALTKLKEKSFNKYKEFWNEYGLVLKEGTS